ASAAPMAASAISCGVIGRGGDIVGGWIEPVTAQGMMTLRFAAMIVCSPFSDIPVGAAPMCGTRDQAAVAQARGYFNRPARLSLGRHQWLGEYSLSGIFTTS